MAVLLVWGAKLEKEYGTLFYASLNLWIGLLSNLMNTGTLFGLAYWAPATVFGY